MLQNCIMELNYESILRNRNTESYYGNVLLNWVPGIHGSPWRPPGQAPGNPPGRPWDLQGPPDPPQATKTDIAQQIYSARSSRLLHLNPLVATQTPLGCFVMYTIFALAAYKCLQAVNPVIYIYMYIYIYQYTSNGRFAVDREFEYIELIS